jgi:hypothetical protein
MSHGSQAMEEEGVPEGQGHENGLLKGGEGRH